MTGAPLVSVVIPALNAERTIGDTLAALRAQVGVPGGFEIVVADNGSTDRTAEIARAGGARVVHAPVRGPSAARNAGLAVARGRIIAHTDSDTVPSRRWLGALVQEIERAGRAVATGPILGWPAASPAERFAEANGQYARAVSVDHPVHPYATGMNLAVRVDDLRDAGGWDPWMGSGEDIDLCIRLRRRGVGIVWAQGASLFHKHRSDDAALWRQARWYGTGLAQLHLKHPDVVRWRLWHTMWVSGGIGCLYAAAPLATAGRALGLMSAERAEFERYYRGWNVHFWGAFFMRLASGEGPGGG